MGPTTTWLPGEFVCVSLLLFTWIALTQHLQGLGCNLERQPRLADAADAGERDQPARPHELGDFGNYFLAANQ